MTIPKKHRELLESIIGEGSQRLRAVRTTDVVTAFRAAGAAEFSSRGGITMQFGTLTAHLGGTRREINLQGNDKVRQLARALLHSDNG